MKISLQDYLLQGIEEKQSNTHSNLKHTGNEGVFTPFYSERDKLGRIINKSEKTPQVEERTRNFTSAYKTLNKYKTVSIDKISLKNASSSPKYNYRIYGFR